MNISDLGLEIIKHPITHVRVQPHGNRWYVEYRRKPKYYFDKWWWFDDSIFIDFRDAYNRAQILAAEGGISEVRKRTIEISVKDFQV
jgi:hypothetical protein